MEEIKYIPVTLLSKLFGMSDRRVQQLVDDGILIVDVSPKGRRKYPFKENIQAYIKYLKEKADGKEKKEDAATLERQKLEADVRYRTAKAAKEEIALDLIRGSVHKADHVRTFIAGIILEAVAELKSVAGRCAVDCSGSTPAEASTIIEKEIFAALSNLSKNSYDPAKFRKMVRDDGDIIIDHDHKEDEE